MTSDVIERLKAAEPELIAIRRDIHRHPETAFEEVRTASIVAQKLTSWGFAVHQGLAKTGVVGTLKGKRAGQKAIGLRADMDALHLQEKNAFTHRSTIDGKMHACGHDGHTTMLLGAARQLAVDPDFAGTVHVIFQPAEEGLGGARVMIEEGLFDLFPCDAVYGMHNAPGLPVGRFAIRSGPMLAASDSWTAVFHGTGGHGSAPNRGTDPTMPAASFILGVQGIVGRNVPPTDTAVLSVGHIAAGAFNSPNVIPSDVTVRGTSRSYRPAVRDILERRLGEVARSTAESWGCSVDYTYQRRYPPLVNTADQTAIAIAAAAATVGAENVDGNAAPITGAEDFAFMLEKKPGAYIMIGNGGDEAGGCHYVHTPLYDFNDEIIVTGAAYWLNVVQQELGAAAG
ncbi:M20 aminoacylase family protein [Vineibacter terrae]|uniref:M20 aminoacylase family protein n=1 Tax=Vineibacter terrae TaxID=2586908 RepID=UPI002E31DD93|nr:M20 aminoacylase family protein [Vineibacter terrae]HEX2888486.1 M20 aminoacylase family protein [Vineibacter terrae]